MSVRPSFRRLLFGPSSSSPTSSFRFAAIRKMTNCWSLQSPVTPARSSQETQICSSCLPSVESPFSGPRIFYSGSREREISSDVMDHREVSSVLFPGTLSNQVGYLYPRGVLPDHCTRRFRSSRTCRVPPHFASQSRNGSISVL
jgi:hypothetical protein